MATKQSRTTKFFSAPLLSLLLDPGWVKIRIRDKTSGSATLIHISAWKVLMRCTGYLGKIRQGTTYSNIPYRSTVPRRVLTWTIAVDVNGPVVELWERLYLQVVSVHLDEAFPGHVLLEVFRHVLGEVVRVMLLNIVNKHGGTVSVADPGSDAFLTSESGIRIQDPGWTYPIIFPRA